MCRANIWQPSSWIPHGPKSTPAIHEAGLETDPPAVGAALGGGNRQQVRRRAVGRTVECLGGLFYDLTALVGEEGKGKLHTPGGRRPIVPGITNSYEFSSAITGWWFQICCIFIPKIGEDEPILTNMFQRGWNHQLENIGTFWRWWFSWPDWPVSVGYVSFPAK